MFAVLNQSDRITPQELLMMVGAATRQLRRHVAPAWNALPRPVIIVPNESAAPSGAWLVVLLNDSTVAGALGFHDLTPGGLPYARVFVSPTLDNGGTVLSGPNAVSVTLSHEICEAFGDPLVNGWMDKGDGTLWANELCDQVEADAYDIQVGNQAVSVSDFLFPEAFSSNPPPGSRFDQLGLLLAPFTLRPDGYAIVMQGGKVSQVFGDHYPAAKQVTKLHPASRTAKRLRQ